MKPVDLKLSIYTDFIKQSNEKEPKFKIGDIFRTLKYKNIFENGCTLNLSEEGFINKKVRKLCTYFISDLNGEEISRVFYEKELQKTNQKKFRIEKVIKRKGDKLHVKWKRYNNLHNSCTDKKDTV